MFSKPAFYFIMGTGNVREKDPLAVLENALQGGITHFQLREKGAGALQGPVLQQFAQDCQALCAAYQVPFLINDDVELALAIGADGVHIGQEDLECAQARARIGKGKMLGVSVHSLDEAQKACEAGADYLGMGPIFGTRSKADAKKPAGTSEIEKVSSHFPAMPIFGIGGITPQNAVAVWQAGATGIAVISALAAADDVGMELKHFRNSYRGER